MAPPSPRDGSGKQKSAAAETTGNVDAENAFEQFLADVDALTISTDPTGKSESRKERGSVTDDSTRATDRTGELAEDTSTSRKKTSVKQIVVARAGEGQRSWQQFREESRRTGEGDSTTVVDSRPENDLPSRQPLSFAIEKKRRKKKKKSSKETPHTNAHADQPPCATKRPRWVAVVDTCCFLDKDNAMANVLDVVHYAARNYHREWAEQVEVVVPFKVWGELDYQSKLVEEDSVTSYRARRAIRMLESELQFQVSRESMLPRDASRNQESCLKLQLGLRTQTLEDMNVAARHYLSQLASKATNDDHILACALAEQHLLKPSIPNGLGPEDTCAGGLVFLTVDRNLSCKALANNLTVQGPTDFADYLRNRMDSLQSRSNPSGILTRR